MACDLYYIRQVLALKTLPVPAKHRENMLVGVWIGKVYKTTIFFSIRKCMMPNSLYLYMKLWN